MVISSNVLGCAILLLPVECNVRSVNLCHLVSNNCTVKDTATGHILLDELSTQHTANAIKIAQRSNVLGRIDRLQQQQVHKSYHYW